MVSDNNGYGLQQRKLGTMIIKLKENKKIFSTFIFEFDFFFSSKQKGKEEEEEDKEEEGELTSNGRRQAPGQ